MFSSTSIREVAAVEQPREVHDEEHERVWERVAAIDVAKGSGALPLTSGTYVCFREI